MNHLQHILRTALCLGLFCEAMAMATSIPTSEMNKLSAFFAARSAVRIAEEDPDTGAELCSNRLAKQSLSRDQLQASAANLKAYRESKAVLLNSELVVELARLGLRDVNHQAFVFPLMEAMDVPQLEKLLDILVYYACYYAHPWQVKAAEILQTRIPKPVLERRLPQEINGVLADEDSNENEWEMALRLASRTSRELTESLVQRALQSEVEDIRATGLRWSQKP